jgi:hypothetical protein
VQYGKLESYKGIFGNLTYETIKAIKNISKHQFSCFIELAPTEEEKAIFEQNAQAAITTGEIGLEDVQMARQIKNTKLAYKYLSLRKKKLREQRMQEAENNTRAQAESQAQASMAIEQNKAQIDERKVQLRAQEIQLETQSKAFLLELEYKLKNGLAQTEGQFKLGAENMRTSSQKEKEEMKEDRKDERIREQKEMESKLIEQRTKNTPPVSFKNQEADLFDDVFKPVPNEMI